MKRRNSFFAGIAVAAVALTACGGGSTQTTSAIPPQHSVMPGSSSSNPIQHIVLVIQENRSFNDFFALFPGAQETATTGLMKTPSGDEQIALAEHDLLSTCDFGHGYAAFRRDYDGGKMDGFNLEANCGAATGPYQYVNPSQIKPYWILAQQYVLSDHMFQTQGSGSFTAHQDLIAGATIINASKTKSLVDWPTATPWGCDAPPGTVTSLLVDKGSQIKYDDLGGPFPCLTYHTLRDLLDARAISWKYYSPPVAGGTGAVWNAFDAIKAVRYGSEWGENVTDSNLQVFTDISNGQLPAVSWLIPDSENSDHPGYSGDTGPSWVASIVNAIGQSSYWQSTAVIILWDDWGGFYDPAPPPFFDQWGGLGFRVPMIVVSAYAPQGGSKLGGRISHTQYEFGSILKFIEDTFGLGRLGTTDVRAHSIAGCFNFSQPARAFNVVPSKYSRAFFERQRPSYRPVDTE